MGVLAETLTIRATTWFDTLLSYLTDESTIIIGGVATTLEILVLLINFCRRVNRTESFSADQPKPSKLKMFMWAANPVNLFRKPV